MAHSGKVYSRIRLYWALWVPGLVEEKFTFPPVILEVPLPEPQSDSETMVDDIVPLKKIEYCCGYVIIGSPYTPYSIYLRGTL